MNRTFIAAMMATLGLSLAGAGLKEGAPAPPFSAQDQEGRTVSLADYRGKATVVLYFYPKDDTPGCTKEACSLRDGFSAITATGAVILGVSADDVASHAAFATKYHLPFPLLADPGKKIIDAYGVRMAVVGVARRVTFIIGPDGIIKHIVSDVKAAEHDKQVLGLL
jgi:thioredoxin-dependent peroxiredoxin